MATMQQNAEAEKVAERYFKQSGPQNAAEIAQLNNALSQVVGITDACILSAAAGGAPIKSTQSFVDKRQSAEAACGEGGFFGRTYENALAKLKQTNRQTAFYINSMAKIRSSQSAKELDEQADEDAEKARKKMAAEAGKVVLAGAGVYALWIGAAALVAFIAVKAAK